MVPPRIFSGFDLGQAADFTALAVTRQVERGDRAAVLDRYRAAVAAWQKDRSAPKPARPRLHVYEVAYLRVWDLGTDYTVIAADAAALYNRAPLAGSHLCLDFTGVGRPVAELLRAAGVDARTRRVTITGGKTVSEDEARGEAHVPKTELVATAVALLQQGLVKVARGIAHADRLKKELSQFTVKVSARSGAEQSGAWADGQHDDLCLSLMLALWLGERNAAGGVADVSVAPPESSFVSQAPPGVFA
jgi:hypothetical protein